MPVTIFCVTYIFLEISEGLTATIYYISGTFDSDFNWEVWRFFLNRQTEVTTNTIFERTL